MSLVEESLWLSLKDELGRRIPEVLFDQWFSGAEVMSCGGGCLVLGVQNRFFKSRIEAKYLEPLRDAAAAALKQDVRVEVAVSPRLFAAFRESQEAVRAEAAALKIETPLAADPVSRSPAAAAGLALHGEYTFDRFIAGPSNRLSHAVCLKMLDEPDSFSRLYFCGQHGVGKTHLLQALCHEFRARRPEAKVVYVTCERFVADFVAAHAGGTIRDFRALYRNCDLLAFDELQALGVGSKAASQAELLGIIDALAAKGAAVVFAASQAPEELEGVDAKLKDRLGAGFVDKLSLPDEQTRSGLLEAKLAERKITLPPQSLALMARELSGNVRKLEGTVNRLAALMEIEGREPTPSCIRMALEVFTPSARRTALTAQDIINAAAEEYGVTPEAVIGRGRSLPVRRARQLALVLGRRLAGLRYTELGQIFGGRSHATIITTLKKIPPETFSSGREGRPAERVLFRLGAGISPEELMERQGELF